ncbi:unnamed protein product [Rhizophagus irregularis]|nr:unnamed protein product [Rhizophagus irregularis]
MLIIVPIVVSAEVIAIVLVVRFQLLDAGTLKRTCLLKRWPSVFRESIELAESPKDGNYCYSEGCYNTIAHYISNYYKCRSHCNCTGSKDGEYCYSKGCYNTIAHYISNYYKCRSHCNCTGSKDGNYCYSKGCYNTIAHYSSNCCKCRSHCNCSEWINDNDYFVYNELKEIEEGTNRTFKKANLNNPKITVAIKNLNNVKITENDFKEFITKLKAFRNINHSNINRFFGLTKDSNNDYFLVWEYVNEGNLRDYLENNFNTLQWNDKIQMALDITQGLMVLHSELIIHGNLHAYSILIKNGIRPEINEVHEILSQLNLRFKIFDDLLTKQQIIKKFKLNHELILTEDNIRPSMKEIFIEDGELNINLYEEKPIVYININMNDLRSVDTCINFPIAEITYKGDLMENFFNDNESFTSDHFVARKILVGGKLFIKEFSSITRTQSDILKFYLFRAYNSSKYSTKIQYNNLFDLNLLPKIVTLDGEELNTHEKLIEWMNNLYQNKMIDIISYDLIPISQLRQNKLSSIDDLESLNEKQPGIVNFNEKLSLEDWVGDAIYDNIVKWTNNFDLFKGLIINQDYETKISKKIAINFNEIPIVKLSDNAYSKMIKPSTNLEVILISNKIFSIKNLNNFPFINNSDIKNYNDHIYNLFKYERYEILLNEDHIKPTKEFEQLIENSLNSINPLKALQDIFNEYGHLFSQRIVLGRSLKNILSNTTSLTREGKNMEKNDLSNWIQNTNNNLEIIEFDNIIPLYKILNVEQQRKIDDILKNDFRIIMTGITDLKDLDNNNDVHYKRINLNSESVLKSEDYEVFGSIISEDNIIDFMQ